MVQLGRRHHKNPNQAIIGGENIDEEVQGFVSNYTTGLYQKNPNQAIIGTENIDEEVQDFASKHTTGLSQKNPNQAIIGTENIDEEVQDFASKHTTGLSQKHHHRKHHKNPKHPDVAERNMDEEVHGFVADNVSGINEIYHSDSAPAYNGGNTFSQHKHHHRDVTNVFKKKKDIAERGMDSDVHGFVWEALPPLNNRERGQY